MELSKDTHLEFNSDDNGDLEIKVISSEANGHEWLTENFEGNWHNVRRFLMSLRRYIPLSGVKYKFYEKNNLVSVLEATESEAMNAFNEHIGEVALVKEELLGYKKE